jgi:hypothetical protein
MDTGAETEAENGVRRSDRWAAEPAEASRNWWSVLGIVCVLAGYGVAASVAAIVKGTIEFGDDAGLVLVGTTPALGALGMTLGFVGRRRDGLHWLAWLAILLGAVLLIASIGAVVWVLLAFRTFS